MTNLRRKEVYDRVRIERTPRNARKLEYWGRVNNLAIPDDIKNLATQRDICHEDLQIQEAWQYIIDNNNRAALIHESDDQSGRNIMTAFNHFATEKLFPMIIVVNEETIEKWVNVVGDFVSNTDYKFEIVTQNSKTPLECKGDYPNSNLFYFSDTATAGKDIYLIDSLKSLNVTLGDLLPASIAKSIIYDSTEKKIRKERKQSSYNPMGRVKYDNQKTLSALFLEISNAVILSSFDDMFFVSTNKSDESKLNVSLANEHFAFITKLLYNEKVLPTIFPLEHEHIKKQLNDSGYKLIDDTFLAYFPLIGISTAFLGDNNGSTTVNDIPE